MERALVIGNSSGIGFGLTSRLLEKGYSVLGISKSESSLSHENYRHVVCNVTEEHFTILLKREICNFTPSLVIYCAGIGKSFSVLTLQEDISTIEVNLVSFIRTASVLIPYFTNQGCGHIIGISSLVDELRTPESPAYCSSKAGLSAYMESLGLALMSKNISVTSIRLGFVDTKMAQANWTPCLLSVDQAVTHIESCIRRKPLRFTAPKRLIPLVVLARWYSRWQLIVLPPLMRLRKKLNLFKEELNRGA